MTNAAELQKENEQLKAQLSEKADELQNKSDQLKSKEKRITLLKELIKQFQRIQFGASGEKIPSEPLSIFNEAEEDALLCPHDGTALKCFGSEDHEQLDIIPATIKVIRHKRLKYSYPCCEQHIAPASTWMKPAYTY